MRYVIDTHALIWFLEGNPRLSSQGAAILADPNSSLVLPAIALAEAVWIVERGKQALLLLVSPVLFKHRSNNL